jgi:penicillin V acylase-like amidase (Ntn superfamily)
MEKQIVNCPWIKQTACYAAALAIAATSLTAGAQACTRAVYLGKDDTVITVRSLDWMEDMRSNLWAFPRGMKRNGAAGPNSLQWVSKYGSLVTSGYDVGTADGINEKGFVANVLYLAESDYGHAIGTQPAISIGAWAQYALDSYSTVDEAVTALSKEPFLVIAPILPNGSPATLHLAVSDVSGDSAIFEYIGGKLVVHHDRKYQVMTNSPSFDQQLALEAYWKSIGGLTFLPGTNRAADRFARASFYIDNIPKTGDQRQATAEAFSVIRSVSVPLGMTTPGQPNIASTIWRTVADHKHKIYFFDSATSPNVFWVPLDDLDLSAGAPVKKLTLVGGKTYAGNAAAQFQAAPPFEFLPATRK